MKKNDVEKMNVTVNPEPIENIENVENTENVLTVVNNSMLPLTERKYNNPELTIAVNTIGNATITGNMATWQIAKACYNIVENKLWNKDFKSQKDFADSIGYANSTITGYKNAVAFTMIHPDMVDTDENGNVIAGITVGKADVLSKIDNYDALVTYCLDTEHTEPHKLGDNKLKKVISEFKKAIEKKDTENTENTENAITGNVERTENTENIVVTYGKTGIRFECDNVPISIINRVGDLLKEYIVATYDKEGNKIGK